MLMVDAKVMETAPAIAVGGPENDDFDTDFGADIATATPPWRVG
jgi:hypothetical protein